MWLGVFFLVPFLIVLKISLSQFATAQPPYLPMLDLGGGLEALRDFVSALTVGSYTRLVEDSLYLSSYGRSVGIALSPPPCCWCLDFRLPTPWRGRRDAGRACCSC